jgi:ankyrin repeat protein
MGLDVTKPALSLEVPESELSRMEDAIYAGDINTVRKMLDSGFPIDVSLNGRLNMTPLYTAAISCNPAICAMLLSRGANIESRIGNGTTPLGAAVEIIRRRDSFETCELLLRAAADVNVTNCFGFTILHQLVLSSRELSVNAKSLQPKDLPATQVDVVRLAKLLVQHGASPSFMVAEPSSTYKTPFQFAVEQECEELVNYFIAECSEDPNQRTHRGALSFAPREVPGSPCLYFLSSRARFGRACRQSRRGGWVSEIVDQPPCSTGLALSIQEEIADANLSHK